MVDSKKRSLAKAISWKFLGFIFLATLTYIATNSLKQTGLVATTYHIFMLGLYMLHERIWNKVFWGKTKGLYIQLTGMSGAGKTTLARILENQIKSRGFKVEVIDGDEYRENLCSDLGFSREDREENIKRLSFVGKVLGRNNVICIMSAINPYNSTREYIRTNVKNSKLVYIKCSLKELMRRDTKGLYKRALLPDDHPDKLNNFTGISDPFDEPQKPDLILPTDEMSIKDCVNALERFIIKEIEK
jgi:adenylylsulfate kinase